MKNMTGNISRHLALGLTLGIVLFSLATPAHAAPAAEKEAKEAKKGSTININAADATQLAFLPRIGPSVAQRIVDYRKKNGPFKTTDDLMLVQGIGEKMYEVIKPYISVSGESSLKEKVRSGKSKAKKGGKTKNTKAAKEPAG